MKELFQLILFSTKVQTEFGDKVGQIRSGGPSGGFKDDFLRSGGAENSKNY